MRLTAVRHQLLHPVAAVVPAVEQAAVAVPVVQVLPVVQARQEVLVMQAAVPVELQQLPQEALHKPLPGRQVAVRAAAHQEQQARKQRPHLQLTVPQTPQGPHQQAILQAEAAQKQVLHLPQAA